MKKAGDITQLLEQWKQGDEGALSQLMELIYDELHRMATACLRRERPDHTLQSSALVHEAYLRLVDQKQLDWQNRAHFLAIAARTMRQILVNHARDRFCAKRGGGAEHLPLDEAAAVPDERLAEYLAVDEALTSLAAADAQQAEIMELYYFGGLSRQEIAGDLGVSVPTVARRLEVARAWLYRHIRGQDEGGR